MLITDHYRAQQKALHDEGSYGVVSAKYAPIVARLIDTHGIKRLLDYGAGSKLTLINAIADRRLCESKFDYVPYEPAIEKHSATPEPAEMVACIDVLEHIEPDLLDNVLDDLKRVTLRVGFFTVSCVPASKVLPDGRNAHLIQEEPEWWLPKFTDRFSLQTFQRVPGGFNVLVTPTSV